MKSVIFFCSGSWSKSLLREYDLASSGVTDFSCGNNHLNNMILQRVVDDWCEDDQAAVQAAYGTIEDWDVSRITNMNDLFNQPLSWP